MSDDPRSEQNPSPKQQILVHSKPKDGGTLEEQIAPSQGHSVVESPINLGLGEDTPKKSSGNRTNSQPNPSNPKKSASKKEKSMQAKTSTSRSDSVDLGDNGNGSDGTARAGVSLLGGLALLAVAGLGFWVYQGQQKTNAMQADISQLEAKLSYVSDGLANSKAVQTDLQQGLTQQVGDINHQLEAQSNRMNQIGASDQDWKLHEARYLLVMAIERLQAFDDVAMAQNLLQKADDRLQEMSSPKTLALRQTLANDLNRLKAVKMPDTQGIWVKLGALGQQLEDLTFFSFDDPALSPHAATDANAAIEPVEVEEDDGEKPAWKQALNQSWQEVKTLVKVREFSPEDFSLVLSAKQQQQLMATLSMLTEQARWAATHKQDQVFTGSLEAAQAFIEKFFVDDDSRKQSLQSINDLKQTVIGVELPDISSSLDAVDAYLRGDSVAPPPPKKQSTPKPEPTPSEPKAAEPETDVTPEIEPTSTEDEPDAGDEPDEPAMPEDESEETEL